MNELVTSKIEDFFSKYPIKRYNKGHTLIFPGENPEFIYHIVSGKVKVYDINSHGEELIVNSFAPPAFFPISWALNKTPNQYFYGILQPSVFRIAPIEDILKFLSTNNDVTIDLLSRVYRGTDVILRRMVHLMGGNATTRVLYELVIESRRTEKNNDGSYNLNLSEKDLAMKSGLSRETVSRVLGSLKSNNLVKINRNSITITNLDVINTKLEHNV